MSQDETIRIFVGADRSQQLAVSVLEYSIKRHTSAKVQVVPMVDLPITQPKDPRNGQRTGFSFSRFCIPKLAGHNGKAIYMDADMLVFRDIRELWSIPFDGAKVVIQQEVKFQEETTAKAGAPKKRKKQCAVMLLDCDRLDWHVEDIIGGMDRGEYDYEELMYDLCILREQDIKYGVPFEWNSLEHWDSDTRLIHYTDVYTQPWSAVGNKFGHLWFAEVRRMLQEGALDIATLQREVDLGYFRPSLMRDLRWRLRLPRFMLPAWDRCNAWADRWAGYAPHKAVYEAKRARATKVARHVFLRALLGRLLGKRSDIAAGGNVGMAADQPASGRRLMIFTEHFNATYFISFDIPLRELHKQGAASFRAYSQQDVAAGGTGCWRVWLDDFKPEAVFMTRYGQADGVDIVRDCKARGIPVVYHIDDNLLELPSSLGAEIVKRQGAAIEARQAMLADCDVIYASTRVLAQTLVEKFPGKPVYQGIYASYLPVETAKKKRAEAETVGYMGSKGHKEDLALVVPALVQLMRERPALRFETFGTIEMPEEMRQFGNRVRHHPVQKSYREFLRTLAGLDWSLGLAPLVDEPFNRCKAPTKFVEYTGCGIPVVASDTIVYSGAIPEGAGVLVGTDWEQAIEALLDDPLRRGQILDGARSHCQQTFSPKLLQEQLLKVTQRAKARDQDQSWPADAVQFL